MMQAEANQTLVLRVSPKIDAEPPKAQVWLSDRNAKGLAKIKWKPKDGRADFTMSGFHPRLNVRS